MLRDVRRRDAGLLCNRSLALAPAAPAPLTPPTSGTLFAAPAAPAAAARAAFALAMAAERERCASLGKLARRARCGGGGSGNVWVRGCGCACGCGAGVGVPVREGRGGAELSLSGRMATAERDWVRSAGVGDAVSVSRSDDVDDVVCARACELAAQQLACALVFLKFGQEIQDQSARATRAQAGKRRCHRLSSLTVDTNVWPVQESAKCAHL